MSRDFSVTKQPSKQWFYGSRSYGMKHVSALQCQTAITRVRSPSMMWEPGFISTLLLAAPLVSLSIQSSI